MPLSNSFNCPLCNSGDTFPFHKENAGHLREFFRCHDCELIFAHPEKLLDNTVEKSRYEHHNNSKRTEGYIKFLRTLIDPVKEIVTKEAVGLDFGSGPYPMLCEIFREDGYEISPYDPYFNPDNSLLSKTYDFVTCCEVVEHFNKPIDSFKQLYSLLSSNGVLGVKTTLFNEQIEFSSWYYKSDDTHISFYSEKTIEWIANYFGLKVLKMEKALIIFQKKS